MEIFASESNVILHQLTKQKQGGILYGLWTQSGKIVVYLAVPENDPDLANVAKDQGLREVGCFTNSTAPPSRPDYLVAFMNYAWICPNADSLSYHTIESHGRRGDPRPADVFFFPLRSSPFRSDLRSQGEYEQRLEQEPFSQDQSLRREMPEEDWVSDPSNARFLRSIVEGLERMGLTVKVLKRDDTVALALSVRIHRFETTWAIGFTPNFSLTREVTIARGGQTTRVRKTLPEDDSQALAAILGGLGIRVIE